MTTTPETDSEEWNISRDLAVVPSEFARKLEIERNEALARAALSSSSHPTKTTMTSDLTAETEYIEAYNRTMKALRNIEKMIHDMPAPDCENDIGWGNVGDMLRYAAGLEEILPEE